MLHSYVKNWIHLIWRTHNGNRLFFSDVNAIIRQHLIEKSIEIKVPFEVLNVQPDHIHGLINLPSDVKLADFMQLIKGESAHWINKEKILTSHFEWQRGFGGFSVSYSHLEKVKNYISNQSDHHKKISFTKEYNDWLKKYDFDLIVNNEVH